MGLAVHSARDAAGLTLNDLAPLAGMTASSLSRSERGERDLAFAEVVAIANAVKIDVETLRSLAESFEREGVAQTHSKASALEKDLNELQRMAIEAVIEARAHA